MAEPTEMDVSALGQQVRDDWTAARREFANRSHEPDRDASIHTFPYATLIRKFLHNGQPARARALFELARATQPQSDALVSLARVLAPPLVRVGAPKVKSNASRLARVSVEHAGKWVAFREGIVALVAPTLKELVASIDPSDAPSYVIHKVPS